MSYINLTNIAKSYNGKDQIINEMNLEIHQGELLVIVGPSGCGKSTLLRMIAGLEDINKGTIEIDGNAVNNMPPAERDIAMVFQNYALYPHMNVRQNLSYGLKNRKISKREIEKRVNDIAKLLQIEDLLTRKPSELSGGQKQRVAMGRAIIRKPKLFLFDEPLSNLDAKLRNQMRIEIRKLHDALKITSVYVTHDQVEAMTLADRIVVLNGGKIEQISTPDLIYDDPKTLFVAQFMGNPPMNIFEMPIRNNSIDFLGNTLGLERDYNEDKIYVGIRPEDISLNPKNGCAEIDIDIDLIERLGSENLIYTTIKNQLLTIKTDKHLDKNSKKIRTYIDRKNFYFFSTADHKRL